MSSTLRGTLRTSDLSNSDVEAALQLLLSQQLEGTVTLRNTKRSTGWDATFTSLSDTKCFDRPAPAKALFPDLKGYRKQDVQLAPKRPKSPSKQMTFQDDRYSKLGSKKLPAVSRRTNNDAQPTSAKGKSKETPRPTPPQATKSEENSSPRDKPRSAEPARNEASEKHSPKPPGKREDAKVKKKEPEKDDPLTSKGSASAFSHKNSSREFHRRHSSRKIQALERMEKRRGEGIDLEATMRTFKKNQKDEVREAKQRLDLANSIVEIQNAGEKVRTLEMQGCPSDEELAKTEKEKAKRGEMKQELAKTLRSSASKCKMAQPELIADFFESLILETDIPPGNTELVQAMIDVVQHNYAALIAERGLATSAACDGSLTFLPILLSVPDPQLDVPELAAACFYNQTCRIPLARLVLMHPNVSLAPCVEELQPQWQEFFEDIASEKRAIPREDRTGRTEVLRFMLETPPYKIDASNVGGDGQNVLSRAAGEGDLELVRMLLEAKQVDLKSLNVNEVQDCGATILMQAVLSNNLPIVNLLLDHFKSAVNVNVKGPNGTAMDIAVSLKRDPQIVKALEEHHAQRWQTKTEAQKEEEAHQHDEEAAMKASQFLDEHTARRKDAVKRLDESRRLIESQVADLSATVKLTPQQQLLLNGISDVQEQSDLVRTLEMQGCPTDDELEKTEREKEKRSKMKQKLAKELQKIATPFAAPQKEIVSEFFESLILETDVPPGNTELVEVLMKKVQLEYAPLIVERGLAVTAACDGSLTFLPILLSVPDPQLDVPELAAACFYNQTCRIPLARLVLMHPNVSLAPCVEELQPQWQEFFEDIASEKRTIPREDRTGRTEVLRFMLETPPYKIDASNVGGDGQNVLSRAAGEGDLELVRMLLKAKQVDLKSLNVNEVQDCGATILMQAVLSNNLPIVNLILDHFKSAVNVNVKGPNGTALDIAIGLRKEGAICDALEAHHAKKWKMRDPEEEKKEEEEAAKKIQHFIRAQQQKKKAALQRIDAHAPMRQSVQSQSLNEYNSAVHEEEEMAARVRDMLDDIAEINEQTEVVRNLEMQGCPSDEELEKTEKEKAKRSEMKLQMAKNLQQMKRMVAAPDPEMFADFFESLILETDVPPGNTELVEAMTKTIDFGLSKLIAERALAVTAACDGSLTFLPILLSVPDPQLDVPELAAACFYNQTCRIPLARLVLMHPNVSLAPCVEELQPQWQEFFEDIASGKRTIPREDRTGRTEVLRFMLETPPYKIDASNVGGDGQNVLSRAAGEGDMELVRMLLKAKQVDLKSLNVNEVQDCGATILMQAVLSNNLPIVNLLLDHFKSAVNVNVKGPTGTAMDIAVGLKKDPQIVKALKSVGANASPSKPSGAPGKSRGRR